MLDEPYRWVEAIRNRREYLEDQLKSASPVVGSLFADGVLLLTTTPGPRKLFEVYNQVAFAAIGHPADIEKLRKAVIDIAHVEAFNLSARDVSLQRLVSFGIGPLMKTAFDEIFHSPFIARVLVAELDAGAGREAFYTVDADGSFAASGAAAAVAGTAESRDAMARHAAAEPEAPALQEALERALETWAVGRLYGEPGRTGEPTAGEISESVATALDGGQRIEVAVLDRTLPTKSKFRLLPPAELEEALGRFAQ